MIQQFVIQNYVYLLTFFSLNGSQFQIDNLLTVPLYEQVRVKEMVKHQSEVDICK